MERRIILDDMIVEESARYIVACLQSMAQETSKKLVIALSGGGSPKALYPVVASLVPKQLAEQLYLIQVDERVLPATHQDSNQRLIHDTLSPLIRNGARFFPMPATAHDAAIQYHNVLSPWFTEHSAVPAIALLGAGEDGHTASIFPETTDTAFPTTDDTLVFKTSKEHNGYYRLSLSYKALFAMNTAIMYVPGKNKSAIVQTISDVQNTDVYPASKILHTHGHCVLLASKAEL